MPTPDEKSIITYVSSLYEGLPALKPSSNQNEKEKVFFFFCFNYYLHCICFIIVLLVLKEKRGLLQEYAMLFKMLARWLNQSVESMQSKAPLPSGYVELKSLIADLKGFRLEEYAQRLHDRNKLRNVYAELQSYYAKRLVHTLRSDEDLRVVEQLWEKLDAALQSRELQLEHAILRSEKMQAKYQSIEKNCEKLESHLKDLQVQLNSVSYFIRKKLL